MDANERQKVLEAISGPDGEQRRAAASRLAWSKDRADLEAAIQVLDETSDRHVRQNIIEGLIGDAPESIEPVLKCLSEARHPEARNDCAYVIGEVAFRQGPARDSRIVPALIDAVRSGLPSGTWATSPVVGALRECVRAAPIPQANDVLFEFLETAAQESEPYLFGVRNAAETLLANDGPPMRERLRAILDSMTPGNRAAEIIAPLLGDT